jgi:hypothetical protein
MSARLHSGKGQVNSVASPHPVPATDRWELHRIKNYIYNGKNAVEVKIGFT